MTIDFIVCESTTPHWSDSSALRQWSQRHLCGFSVRSTTQSIFSCSDDILEIYSIDAQQWVIHVCRQYVGVCMCMCVSKLAGCVNNGRHGFNNQLRFPTDPHDSPQTSNKDQASAHRAITYKFTNIFYVLHPHFNIHIVGDIYIVIALSTPSYGVLPFVDGIVYFSVLSTTLRW